MSTVRYPNGVVGLSVQDVVDIKIVQEKLR